MYSPQIAKHTPTLYRLGKTVGKPMTQVADDLLSFAYHHLTSIYAEMDDEKLRWVLMGETNTEKLERKED